MKQHIEEAIHNFRIAGSRYQKPERYYRGQHDLAFATEKFENAFGSLFREFAMNLCPAVCDAIRDKLRITSFQVQSPSFSLPGADEQASSPKPHAEACTLNIWRRNRMQLRAGEVHREALVSGDAYAIVWPDEDGHAAIFPNRAANVTVTYDEDRPGRITRAAKFWRTADKHTRLNLFYPDRIERYISAKPGEGTLPEPREFVPYVQSTNFSLSSAPKDKQAKACTLNNPYKIVPVFHFANNADIGASGRSELESAIPVQDGLNKSVLDMLVAMEYSAFRQRWVAGLEVERDDNDNVIPPFKAGINNLWTTPNDKAQFGDFNTTDLDQFLKVKDSFRIDMASVTGTPMYYLLPHTRGFPSGEAMQRAESRFIAKVRDRQSAFGQTWSDVMQFAAMIDGMGNLQIETRWEDPSQTTERERLESILLKKRIGLPTEQALAEAGY
jgi:Phage portal protein, SPP1 Gp6-like.